MEDTLARDDTLGATAFWAAAVRARESAREDHLFDDPWAARLAGETGRAWIEGKSDVSLAPMTLRTRFFDDFLCRTAEQEEVRQIVLLAAGLDTRAFRLAWPEGTRFYGVDRGPVLDYAAQMLAAAGAQPRCEYRAVGADLAQPWQSALLDAGFERERPAAFLLEGFMFYLPDEQIIAILRDVSSLAAGGSRLGFDIVNHLTLTSPYTKAWIDMQAAAGAPWLGGLDDPVGFLTALGWRATLAQAGQPDLNFGRWTLPVLPIAMPNTPHHWLVTARRE